MRRVLPLLMLVTAAVLAACSAPAEAPPPPRPPVAAQPVEVVAFLRQDATAAQKRAIADAMRAEPGASGVRFMSAAEAYEQFKRAYRDDPELTGTVKPQDLPASYRVTLPNQTAADAAAARLRGLPGVDQVRIPPPGTPTPEPS